MSLHWSFPVVLAASLSMVGCGTGDVVVPTVPAANYVGEPSDSLEGLKERIKQISLYGDGGSMLDGVEVGIGKFVTDPTKKASLLKDLRELGTSGEPTRNQKIATRMLSNLP